MTDTFFHLLGPISRIVCCLVPFAWVPALVVVYVRRQKKQHGAR